MNWGSFQLEPTHALVQRNLKKCIRGQAWSEFPREAWAEIDKRRAAIFRVCVDALLAFFGSRIDLHLRLEGPVGRVAHAETHVQTCPWFEAVARIERLLQQGLGKIAPVLADRIEIVYTEQKVGRAGP